MYSLGIIYILDLVVSYQSVSGVFARMPPCVPFGNWLGETTISNTVRPSCRHQSAKSIPVLLVCGPVHGPTVGACVCVCVCQIVSYFSVKVPSYKQNVPVGGGLVNFGHLGS